jgi:hypothetical protein
MGRACLNRKYVPCKHAPFRFLNRAGDFHRTRFLRGRLSATGIAPDFVIPHSPQLPPKRPESISRGVRLAPECRREEELRNVSPVRSFPLCAALLRSEYYDRTDARDRLGGEPIVAICRKPPTFTKTDSTRQVGWRLARIIGNPRRRKTASGLKQGRTRSACFAFIPRRLKPAVSAIRRLRAPPDLSAAPPARIHTRAIQVIE